MQEMSKLQRYRTGPDAGDRKYPTWVPVADYMDKEGREELAKHHMSVSRATMLRLGTGAQI